MKAKTEGELLFEEYLRGQSIPYDYEPVITGKSRKVDFVISHLSAGKVFCEVKDICSPPPIGSGRFALDPYKPIHEHIEEGTRKFSEYGDELCVLALKVREGSLADIESPHIMLGAMYGDMGFTIPFNPILGHHDSSEARRKFIVGRGKMLRKSRIQNSRIAAIISLMNYNTHGKELRLYLDTDDGRTAQDRWVDAITGKASIQSERIPCVTVWENAFAKRKLPPDLFKGEMDAWWTANTDGTQTRSFTGVRRARLKIDKED